MGMQPGLGELVRPIIEVRDVKKFFRNRDGEPHEVLRGLSFEVGDHEVVGVIGPSGCGKTTLLRIIAGLTSKDGGEVIGSEGVISGPGSDRRMVFQDFALLPWRTVLRNVEFGLEVQGVGRDTRRSRAVEAIARVGLKGFEDYLPNQLSGGMQQRVGLARALVMRPKILLMDEPFSALDAQTKRVLHEDVIDVVEDAGQTVILVTHDMDEAVLLCDRLVILSPAPSSVEKVVDVGAVFPRPRAGRLSDLRRSAEFGALVEEVWQILRR